MLYSAPSLVLLAIVRVNAGPSPCPSHLQVSQPPNMPLNVRGYSPRSTGQRLQGSFRQTMTMVFGRCDAMDDVFPSSTMSAFTVSIYTQCFAQRGNLRTTRSNGTTATTTPLVAYLLNEPPNEWQQGMDHRVDDERARVDRR